MNNENNTTFTPENYVFEEGQHKDKKGISIILAFVFTESLFILWRKHV